jgi:hypothetical protein
MYPSDPNSLLTKALTIYLFKLSSVPISLPASRVINLINTLTISDALHKSNRIIPLPTKQSLKYNRMHPEIYLQLFDFVDQKM